MKFSTALLFTAAAFGTSGVAATDVLDKTLEVAGSVRKDVAQVTLDDIKAEVSNELIQPLTDIADNMALVVGANNRRHLNDQASVVTVTGTDEEYYCFYDEDYKGDAMLLHPYLATRTKENCKDGFTGVHYKFWEAACSDPFDETYKGNDICYFWQIWYHINIEYPDFGDDKTVVPDDFDTYADWAQDHILRTIETKRDYWESKKVKFFTERDAWAAEGDPHFKTWSGKWFDFMGACDLKLLHAPKFDEESALDVNIRTKIRNDYSYIENVVIQLGEDTLEVASFGDYWLNGVQTAELPATVGGNPVTFSQPTKKLSVFTIQIDDADAIVVKAFKDIVSVKFLGVESARFGGSLGMIGSYDMNGKLIARDGKTEIFDPNEFANEWQIRQDEPMLFQSANGPQHPAKCQLPDPMKSTGRRLGETIAQSAAEKACAKYAPDNQEACVHDVMAYGDLDLAAAGAA